MASSFRYEPNSAILGDFVSVQDARPRVVFNYLATCAQATITDLNPCLVSTFVDKLYPDGVFPCIPPNLTMTEVEMTVQAAHNDCAVANITTMPPYNQVVANRFHSILSARRCWSNLCSTQIHLKLESSWIKSCADIELPFPTLPTEGMFSMAADRVYQDSVLTCMLDYAMDLPPLVFGLDAATSSDGETCFPPGYSEDDPRICRDTIAPYVLSNCTQLVEKDEEFPMDRFMSFTYGDGGGGGNNGYDFVGEFCNLLLDLGSVENRACLLDLCNSTGTENPSASPTFVPSFTPSQSVRPSATALPSGEPSASVP